MDMLQLLFAFVNAPLFATFLLIFHGLFLADVGAQRTLGVNVNLWWGLVLLLFGVVMLALSYVSSRRG